VVAYFFFFLLLLSPRENKPITDFTDLGFKYRPVALQQPCSAGVSSDRTNLSPFTKDYRGLALQCD